MLGIFYPGSRSLGWPGVEQLEYCHLAVLVAAVIKKCSYCSAGVQGEKEYIYNIYTMINVGIYKYMYIFIYIHSNIMGI